MTSLVSESVSNNQARRLALDALGFGRVERGRPVAMAGFRTAMARLHVLQLDAVPIVARTQYMPAYSRLGPYRVELLDRMAYRNDEWFEAWSHEASLLPVGYQPLMRWSYDRARGGEVWRNLRNVATEQPALVRQVLKQVRDNGPLRASELTNPGPRHSIAGWGSRTQGALALGYLFRCGEVGIRRVGNFEKEFDVIENIVPAKILDEKTMSEADALRELLVLSAQAHGVGSANDLIDYFRLPIRAARPLFDSLVEDGRLERVSVEGWRLPAFKIPGSRVPASVNCNALVSPFDPLVWFRNRGEALFDFEYRLEIYTPQKKRRWGYYVFPFLMGDRLVARCDLRFERDTGVLRVPAAHIEAGCDTDDVAEALADELVLMAQWLGAERVVVGRKGDLVSALRPALKRR